MMKIRIRRFGFFGKLFIILVSSAIAIMSLFFSNMIADELRTKEQQELLLWSTAISKAGNLSQRTALEDYTDLLKIIVDNNNTIPSIAVNQDLDIVSYTNIPRSTLEEENGLGKLLEEMARENKPIRIESPNNLSYYSIFYKESPILRMLVYYPYLQLSVIIIFVLLAFISFDSSRRNEQNRVWVGMAKETAHQLGTPTSSLLGWLEYLKEQQADEFVVTEMGKDISRLLKVVDRFSKIGSATLLEPKNISPSILNTINYFKTRIPKKVTLEYINEENNPLQAMVNDALFEWVLENLMKNALDAMQGEGTLSVITHDDKKWIYVDIKDTGKGIPKSNFKKIFSPGFTTKTRGWGLGLSLSYKIIANYHKGKIFVLESEADKGTTFRIMLRRL